MAAHATQRIVHGIGYSETAFAAPLGDGWRVRYFSPESEVPFCGRATNALRAAPAAMRYELDAGRRFHARTGHRHRGQARRARSEQTVVYRMSDLHELGLVFMER